MAICSTTLCFPTPERPTQGVFIARRLAAIARHMPVRVVVPVPWFPLLVEADCAGQAQPRNVGVGELPVRYARMFYFPRMLKSLDGMWYRRALAAALRGCFESCGTGVPPVNSPAGRRCHRGVLKQFLSRSDEGIELIDAHFVWPDGVGAWRVARRRGLPFVCTIRGKLVSQIANVRKRRQIRDMLLDADGLIAVSQSLANLACEVAGRRLDIAVIPNGVDATIFNRGACPTDRSMATGMTRVGLGWTQETRYAISVGHVQALKGFHHLVQVWPEVRRRAGDVRLVLVGGPAGEPDYERRVAGLIEQNGLGGGDGAEAVVRLTGRLSAERVAALLRGAELFVLASRSEGWCNALAEALACGCPVVATDVGGNREIVDSSVLGHLVPAGDVGALTEAIVAALEAPWDRAAIASRGGRRDWQQVAAECVDVFQRVLGR